MFDVHYIVYTFIIHVSYVCVYLLLAANLGWFIIKQQLCCFSLFLCVELQLLFIALTYDNFMCSKSLKNTEMDDRILNSTPVSFQILHGITPPDGHRAPGPRSSTRTMETQTPQGRCTQPPTHIINYNKYWLFSVNMGLSSSCLLGGMDGTQKSFSY